MPWFTSSAMSQRHEFVLLAKQPDANLSLLCQRFGISRTTGYKWLTRFRDGGEQALADRSRKPHSSPNKTPSDVELATLELRDTYPVWGGRKISRVLSLTVQGQAPAPSTITDILRRHGRLPEEKPPRDYIRFEAEKPNDLWQMDFKGDFLLGDRSRTYPLTLTDDHSRFALCLQSCSNQRGRTVRQHVTNVMARYGIPRRILCDNGSPWGTVRETDGAGRKRWRCTQFAAWLIRHGITVVHGRPYHPQTQGKEERFHRTLNDEVVAQADGGLGFADATALQARLDEWRIIYNEVRPHDSLGLDVPASRYAVSPRSLPSREPVVEYDEGVLVRRVDSSGKISFQGREFRIGKGLRGEPVGMVPTETDGLWTVRYGHQDVWSINLSPLA